MTAQVRWRLAAVALLALLGALEMSACADVEETRPTPRTPRGTGRGSRGKKPAPTAAMDDAPSETAEQHADVSVAIDPPSGCKAGLTSCAGSCVDLNADPKNCNACGHDCQGGACQGSSCQPIILASGQDLPEGIAVDSTSVYWTASGARTVMKVPLGGGSATTLASGQTGAWGIAVDGTSVYWTTLGTVMKVSLSGGQPITLATWGPLDFGGGGSLAVDGTSVYWSRSGNGNGWAGHSQHLGTVMKVSLYGGGSPTTLASGQAHPYGIAVDGTSVYWVNQGGGTVMKVRIGGGQPVALASGQKNPYDIAVDATSVYWTTNGGGGTVMKVALGGGGSPTTLASGQTNPVAVAVDATSVYWTSYDKLMKVAK